MHNLSTKDTIKYFLSEPFGKLKSQVVIKLTEDKPIKADEKVIEMLCNYWFLKAFAKGGIPERGISIAEIKQFQIGYDDGNWIQSFIGRFGEQFLKDKGLINDKGNSVFKGRIIFPIKDNKGKIMGFSGRTIHNQAMVKYLNNRAFKKEQCLFNINHAAKKVVLVEGFMDVVAYFKAGINSAVALMGATLSNKQLALLKDKQVYLHLDNDKAGLEATQKIQAQLATVGIENFVIQGIQGLDPDEISKIPNGLTRLKNYKNYLVEE
ncbi:toprim domain-containing protein [Candidatus Mycoplasma pogonae]